MTEFDRIREKVLRGVRISENDAIFLYESPRLFEIGQLADIINYRKNKDVVFYNINTHLNPTNICVMSCKFCGFARKPGEEGAYAYTLEEILAKATQAVENGAKELHMVGGLHPRWGLEYFASMFRAIKTKFPDVHIKALTAVEIDWLARKSRKSHSDVLLILKDAGLDSMPGGGAEIFHPDCRDVITAKLATEDWLAIHRTAHNMGLKTNCTMLYGHVESYAHRVYHFQKLRALQDETHGFNCFIPLAFQPHNNEMGIERYTFGADDLKTIAVARLYLDNFQQIKSYWVMLGQDIAQLGLHFGANDMDGTVNDEKISNMAGGRAGIGMQKKSIKRLILKSRKNPQERDTLYNSVGSESESAAISKSSSAILPYLQKAVDRELLSSEDVHFVAEQADLFTLAMTAQKIRNHFLPYNQASCNLAYELDLSQAFEENAYPLGSSIILDLANLGALKSELTLGALFKAVSKLQVQDHSLVLAGFGSVWKLLQGCTLTLAEIFQQIRDLGVKVFASSLNENEASLTHREIVKLHRTAHASGLITIAKVEINSPPTELTPPWKSFIERVIALRTLQAETHGISAICVEPASDSWVTAQEYMRAVALVRIACPNIEHVIVPFQRLPTSRELHLMGEGGQGLLRGQEKYAPLLLLAGADDFGSLPKKTKGLTRIYEEIASVGMRPRLRDSHFVTVAAKWEDQLESPFDLRHVPVHEMTSNEVEQNFYLNLDWDSAQGVGENASYH